MWDVKACRGCLSVKGKLEKIGDASKRVYSALTDLSITDCDGYPNYFCMECRSQIKKCLAFRRKTRRAHFVLKEIMSVRQQVTYSDIVTVNRKKTNLESSLNFWDPQKSGYVVVNPEGNECETEKPHHTHSTRVVEIKPLVETAEAAVHEEPKEDAIEAASENNDIPDTSDFDVPEPEEPIPEDIDMTDVFKDLNDDKSDTETVVNEVVKKKRSKVEDDQEDLLMKMLSGYSRLTILNSLELYTMTVLDVDQQKDRIALRRSQPPFSLAIYKCSMCLTIHDNMRELVEHVAYHNERRQGHECEVCMNKYSSVEHLNIHIAQCHMYEYKCECGIIVYSLLDAMRHAKKDHKNTALHGKDDAQRAASVAEALQGFTRTALSQRMMSEVLALKPGNLVPAEEPESPQSKNKLKCDVCGLWLFSRANLETHMTMRHKYLYTCNECKEVFTARSEVLKHADTHQDEYCVCEHCGVKFKDKKKWKYHRCPSQVLIPCNLCGISYSTTFKHHQHQLIKHKYISLNDPLIGDPQYKCGTCGVQFVDKAGYEKHLVCSSHAGAEDLEFACLPCKKLFDDEEQMETHFITCARNKKYPRKCCYCEQVLSDPLQYKQHFFREHPTLQYRYVKRNSICELCGRMVQKQQLEAHLRMHSSSAHECRHCGLASAAAAAHVAHVLAAHAARPYCCALCPRRFQHRSDCKDHILKVHAPSKLYKCEFCDLEFSYFKHLRDHSLSQHDLIIPVVKGRSKKSNKKIFVYAHMFIEINSKEKDAVENCEIAMLDYLDQKSKTVDYKDHFRFIEDPDEYIVRIHKRLRKKNKRGDNAKIKIESDVVVKPGEPDTDLMVKKELKREIKKELKEEPVAEIEISLKDEFADIDEVEIAMDEVEIEKEATDAMATDAMATDAMATDVMATDAMATDVMATDAMETDGNPLEVFENDGNQYVMINGEMYRIACDGEDE